MFWAVIRNSGTAAPAWVTVTTSGVSPVTVTVILATRVDVVRFSLYVAVSVPLPVPEAVTVHQVWSLVEPQSVLEVTLNAVLPAAVVTTWFVGLTLKVGVAPDWVTVTVNGVNPTTVTVIVAIREFTDVFSV